MLARRAREVVLHYALEAPAALARTIADFIEENQLGSLIEPGHERPETFGQARFPAPNRPVVDS